MKKEKIKSEEKIDLNNKEAEEPDRGGKSIATEGEEPCPDNHDNIIICTECPGEPRFCANCLCAHKIKKHNGGIKHIKEKVMFIVRLITNQ